MFDFIRNHTRVLFFVLIVLIIPSFVFVGIQGYSPDGSGGNKTVAKVAGNAITQAEWDRAHLDEVERARQQMPNVDPQLLDSAEMKNQTLETLVRRRVMQAAAEKAHFVTTDARLARLFATDPQFEFLRRPDGSLNTELLAAQGMSSEGFAQRLRQDFSVQQVMKGVADTSFSSTAVAAMALDAMFERRDVQVVRFNAQDYAAKVNPSEADLEAYYKDPSNASQFQASEQMDIQYVLLDLESVGKGLTVSEGDLRKYYEENKDRYKVPEERRASHILIKADKDAAAEVRAKARAKAESLLAEAKARPTAFADLARKNSEDTGSAVQGGDLDFFGRGAMVKAFEDAAFGTEVGALSPVVETDYGFHIILVTDRRGGEAPDFAAVRSELEDEVRTQLAQKRFTELAVEFSNMVYEQPDSLAPVAEKLGLELRTASGVQRQPAPKASGVLANEKFLQALFSSEAIRSKRNTEALEIGPNQMVSGRVVQHSPARLLPFAEVKDKILSAVRARQALALARKEGEARLAAWKAASQATSNEPSQQVSRAQRGDLPGPLLDAILRAPTASLPAVLGVDLAQQGYAVVRVNKVLGRDPVAADTAGGKAQYEQAWSNAEAQAYYAALKARFKAEVMSKAPETPAQSER
jgi:peptidyl-prolyl cis-trans isomerase D